MHKIFTIGETVYIRASYNEFYKLTIIDFRREVVEGAINTIAICVVIQDASQNHMRYRNLEVGEKYEINTSLLIKECDVVCQNTASA